MKRNGDCYRNMITNAGIMLYRTVDQHYFFDMQKDEVKKISKELYEFIENGQNEITSKLKEEIDNLKENGYLQTGGIRQIECCIGDYKRAVQTGVSIMVFQVTQMCNLKCGYCPHAQDDNSRMRKHANVRMSKEMALKGIDFLADHSEEKNVIDISFFGGEPLIEFDLIKETVLYAEEKLGDKQITFNISTNAILLTEEKINFLSKHKFSISISMDGPKNIHDKNRKDWSGNGSFQRVYENFLRLKKKVRNTESKIIISAVLDKQCDLDEAEAFFQYIESDKVIVLPALVDDLSSTVYHAMTDEFYWKITYYKFLVMLYFLKKINESDIPITARPLKNELSELYYDIRHVKHTVSPVLEYQIGDCGEAFKLYLNCQGNFYPIVGVNETENNMIIGSIDKGIVVDRIEHLLKIASIYKNDCKICPAAVYCRLGITCCVEEKGITEHIKREYCRDFIGKFHEAIGLSILADEVKEYYGEIHSTEITVGNRNEVIQHIFCVISNVTSERVKCLGKNIDEVLVSRNVGMSALELTCLLCELEKDYHITFGAEDVLDYRFCTIQNIAALILSKKGN